MKFLSAIVLLILFATFSTICATTPTGPAFTSAPSNSTNFTPCNALYFCGTHARCINATCICDEGYDAEIKPTTHVEGTTPALPSTGLQIYNCLDINECDFSPCLKAGTCNNLDGSFECTCFSCHHPGNPGDYCERCYGPCLSQPCLYGGICNNNGTGYSCSCTCNSNKTNCDDCTQDTNDRCVVQADGSQPCFNGGHCIEDGDTFHCICKCGFVGRRCQVCGDINKCYSKPYKCVQGTCYDVQDRETCYCNCGFGRENCQVEYDCFANATHLISPYCDPWTAPANQGPSDPCEQTCYAASWCSTGYKPDIQINSRDCTHLPLSKTLTRTTLPVCQDIDECDSDICQNGGTCKNTVGSFICTCLCGYHGDRCQFTFDACNPWRTPDVSGVKNYNCPWDEVDGFCNYRCSVNCKNGYKPEGNETICRYNHTDVSPTVWSEVNLTCVDINECLNDPCINGNCRNTNGSFNCDCSCGMGGKLCNQTFDQCDPWKAPDTKEVNDFNCSKIDLGGVCRFYCWAHCNPGFKPEGSIRICDYYKGTVPNRLSNLTCVDIDECLNNPCINGICQNSIGSFNCECPCGWGGKLCNETFKQCELNATEVKIDYCSGFETGGNCIYDCPLVCNSGFEPKGDRTICSYKKGTVPKRLSNLTCIDIDECLSNPCNRGNCTNTKGTFECECPCGNSGTVCDVNYYLPCDPWKTQNTTYVKNFECSWKKQAGFCQYECATLCDDGFEPHGNNSICSYNDTSARAPLPKANIECRDIDECKNNPCADGTCRNTIGSFDCICPCGVGGTLCDQSYATICNAGLPIVDIWNCTWKKAGIACQYDCVKECAEGNFLSGSTNACDYEERLGVSDLKMNSPAECLPVCSEPLFCSDFQVCSVVDTKKRLFDCPPRIFPPNQRGVVDELEVFIKSTQTKVNIDLECEYAEKARYEWSYELVDAIKVLPTTGRRLDYDLILDQATRDIFTSDGINFVCRVNNSARIGDWKNERTEARINLRGVQEINYGQSIRLKCAKTNVNDSYVWKIDGKVLPNKVKREEEFAEKPDRPKRIFVECKDPSDVNPPTAYTLVICGREELQQWFRYGAMLALPALLVILVGLSFAVGPMCRGRDKRQEEEEKEEEERKREKMIEAEKKKKEKKKKETTKKSNGIVNGGFKSDGEEATTNGHVTKDEEATTNGHVTKDEEATTNGHVTRDEEATTNGHVTKDEEEDGRRSAESDENTGSQGGAALNGATSLMTRGKSEKSRKSLFGAIGDSFKNRGHKKKKNNNNNNYELNSSSNEDDDSNQGPLHSRSAFNRDRMWIVSIQLLVLPLYSSFSYMMDVATDYLACVTYIISGDAHWGMATLALILLSSVVTSTIAAMTILFEEKESATFERLTKTKLRRCFTFVCMFFNVSPILIQLDLFLDNFQIYKALRRNEEETFEQRHKYEKTLRLLMKLAVAELVCESLGQGILQMYILSGQLGKQDVCIPDKDTLRYDINSTSWFERTDRFEAYSVQKGSRLTTVNCNCDNWVAEGVEHCYPEAYASKYTLTTPMRCFVSDCSTNKLKFEVIFPFVQVVSSVLQISFAMTHLGAVNNLRHVKSLQSAAVKAGFYLITWFYFLISLGTSLVLSTFLANNYKEEGSNASFKEMQMLAFFSIFRLLLPDATPLRRILPRWALRVLSIFLPLAAHMPFYLLIYRNLEGSQACQELTRNRMTLHLHQNRTFNNPIVSYHVTAPELEAPLVARLKALNLFPVRTDDLPVEVQMPTTTSEAVLNLRNDFNIFGHFFQWTGTLMLVDMGITFVFLIYWILVVRPERGVSAQQKLIERIAMTRAFTFLHVGDLAYPVLGLAS